MYRLLRPWSQRYRVRKIIEWYYNTFYLRPDEYTVRYNDITGPYKLFMRLADGPGMWKRLDKGTEMEQRRVFLPLLEKGWICCDVGAHIGDYSIEMALLVGSQGKIFAYEPVPHYFEFLEKTVKANHLTNVVTKQAVVGAKAGKVTIPCEMLTGNIARPGRIANADSARREEVAMAEVPVIRLDDELSRLDAIKVDCEGYEVEVLKGMEMLTRTNPGLILFLEVHNRQLVDMKSSLSELGTLLLKEYGFTIHKIGFKHCICSKKALPLGHFLQLRTLQDFVTQFRET